MKALKFHFHDTDPQEIIKITDREYENLERLAETLNIPIQDVIRILIANGLRLEEFDV